MKRINKAVIPVAGLGTRFLPATKAIPKELLPIVDKPALQYVIEEALASGISEIILVTNPLKDLIQEHFSSTTIYDKVLKDRGKHHILNDLYDLNEKVNIRSIYQNKPLGLGDAILTAKEAVGNEWFIVLLPDMLVEADPPCTAQMIKVWKEAGKPVILAGHAEKEVISRYGVIDVDQNIKFNIKKKKKVSRLIEKPKSEVIQSDLFIAGRYMWPPTVFNYLKDAKAGKGGEVQLTDALIKIVKNEGMVAYESNGVIHDTGDKIGYLKANFYYGMKREDLKKELWDYIDTLKRR
ncbi:MAG: UTP--glucose-1-phosphate uridylyltransferase [Deltaproteobacteria bacterium]|nr:UTP--glucose-1-phosphate uridylyltransferase [Deltaproteobacteria bacterium]